MSSISIVCAVFFLLFFRFVIRSYKPFENGIDGENAVRKELSKLPSSFYSEYDFKNNNKGNTDAIVVGPNGLWSIEVKSHKGEILFKNGQLFKNGYPFEKDFLAQSYAESKGLEEYLQQRLGKTFHVNPVLVFSNKGTKLYFGFNKQKGVYVIGISWLLDLIQNETRSYQLTPQQCLKISSEVKKFTSVI